MAIIIGIGSNLSFNGLAPEKLVVEALKWLQTDGFVIKSVSSLYRTKPVYKDDQAAEKNQPDFINAAAVLNSDKSAEKVLERLHACEAAFGRRRADRWDARTLDLDILDYKGNILPSPTVWQSVVDDADPTAFINQVTVPHPRLHRRGFALLPVAEILPSYKHPVTGRCIEDMLHHPVVALMDDLSAIKNAGKIDCP